MGGNDDEQGPGNCEVTPNVPERTASPADTMQSSLALSDRLWIVTVN